MSRRTPITISSESDSPVAVTITSASDSAQTISSDRNPDVALVSEVVYVPEEEDDQRSDTIEHVDSGSDDLEVLEAEAETARARREEREALERLAKARRARGSNSSARSVHSVRSSISSARFEARSGAVQSVPIQPAPSVPIQPVQPVRSQPAQSVQTQAAQSAPPNPPVLPVSTVPELPTAQPGWLGWFATHAPRRSGPLTSAETQMLADAGVDMQSSEFPAFVAPYVSVRSRVAELERIQAAFEHGSNHGKEAHRFLERDWELQSARARVQELESMIKRQGSRTSFESVVSADPTSPPGLPAAGLHSRPMSVAEPWDPLHEWYDTPARVQMPDARLQNLVLTPEFAKERAQYDAASAFCAPPTPPPGGGEPDDSSSSSSDDEDKKRKKKKKKKGPYAVKNGVMNIPPYPNALTFQSWRRNVRTAAISACEKPERARVFMFSVESDGASFDSLAVDDTDRHRALDAKLADALLKVVKGDLSRRLAVMSESLAKHGRVLAGRQILFMIYKEFGKDVHQTDCMSYSHLEKMQCAKDIKGLETFLAVWDNLMLNFQTPPTPDHMYSAFLTKVRGIPELQEPLRRLTRLPWGDQKKTYESLRQECDLLIEENRQERQSRQLDQLYDSGSIATALAATPEEKAKLPCFYLRDGKPCPNGKSCSYSHRPDIIELAKKAKEAKGRGKGGKGKGKGKGKGEKGKGKGKGKVCPFFNDKGCNYGSACKMLREAPAMAAKTDQTPATPAPKAKAAAAPKAAAADASKP